MMTEHSPRNARVLLRGCLRARTRDGASHEDTLPGVCVHSYRYAVWHRACLNGVVHGYFNALPPAAFSRADELAKEVARCQRVLRQYDVRLSTHSCTQYKTYAEQLHLLSGPQCVAHR